ncbi:translation initiation factor IF-2 subunit gamma [Candidatus Woesearchaeota archaeon]|nr:translation initiation factor IF-2 subunit gamma [Candidatus Woesearchaeota archaeon]MBW3005366.1 translation initiation factor IF-2 subunit gamma [Candidatus Woesearchaeota archaeon]
MGKKKATKKTTKKKSSKKKEEAVQPEISIGLIGHVDHGKTTLVKALTNKWTDTHSEEIKRGITIRLGYADMSIYKCTKCPEPECYNVTSKCKKCGGEAELLRKASLVDAPGHESLMATMICGANIMDGAILLIGANEECPQPQTQEHLMALEIMHIDKVIVVQNKIDLVSEEQAEKNYKQIKEFLKNTKYKDAPIIPISALHSINIDLLLQEIQKRFPTPERDLDKDPIMFVARSFDINKPGSAPEKIKGGVLGGAIKQGKLENGDEIEILPGYSIGDKKWKPLKSKIASLMAGGASLDSVHPGGSMAAMTELDPSIVKSDQLVGSVVGKPGKLPPVWYNLKLETHLLDRVVGAKDKLIVEPIKKGEFLMLNVNSAATVGIVNEIGKKRVECTLKRPICAENEAKVTISRRVGQRWRLIGYGIIKE